MWTLDDAINLCCNIERICPPYGCHVALTGGVLYKGGPRKDLDLVFYRIRNVEKIRLEGLFASLAGLGIRPITPLDDWRWVIKATTSKGRSIDFFFPEAAGGDYQHAPAPSVDVEIDF